MVSIYKGIGGRVYRVGTDLLGNGVVNSDKHGLNRRTEK